MNLRKTRPILQIRNRTLLLADLVLIVTAVLASFALRLDVGPLFNYYLPSAWTMVVIALASMIGCWAWATRIMALPEERRVFPERSGQ